MITQKDVVGLLELGSKVTPRISDGEAGQKQLVEVKTGGVILAEVLKKNGENNKLLVSEILGRGGMPPLPGTGVSWAMHNDGGYPEE